ncbi:MAG: response regulator [Sandaracinaceae bacterium]|nr:response regulator [Sandaracinaceae bacterium]
MSELTGTGPNPPATILIAEDERIVARDMEQILTRAGHRVLGVVGTAADCRREVQARSPDLLLLDIGLGEPDDGLELARNLEVPIVFVSGRSDVPTLKRAGGLSVRGYVVKPFTAQQLLASVTMALESTRAAGELSRTREALRSIARTLEQAGIPLSTARAGLKIRAAPGLELLSAREREVLNALLAHRRPPQIAEELFISPHTVRNHFKSIYAKLGVHSQAELLELLVIRDEV